MSFAHLRSSKPVGRPCDDKSSLAIFSIWFSLPSVEMDRRNVYVPYRGLAPRKVSVSMPRHPNICTVVVTVYGYDAFVTSTLRPFEYPRQFLMRSKRNFAIASTFFSNLWTQNCVRRKVSFRKKKLSLYGKSTRISELITFETFWRCASTFGLRAYSGIWRFWENLCFKQ